MMITIAHTPNDRFSETSSIDQCITCCHWLHEVLHNPDAAGLFRQTDRAMFMRHSGVQVFIRNISIRQFRPDTTMASTRRNGMEFLVICILIDDDDYIGSNSSTSGRQHYQ